MSNPNANSVPDGHAEAAAIFEGLTFHDIQTAAREERDVVFDFPSENHTVVGIGRSDVHVNFDDFVQAVKSFEGPAFTAHAHPSRTSVDRRPLARFYERVNAAAKGYFGQTEVVVHPSSTESGHRESALDPPDCDPHVPPEILVQHRQRLRVRFSEPTELVLEEMRSMGLREGYANSPTTRNPVSGKFGFEEFNDLVDRIRIGVKSPEFLKARRRRVENSKRQYASCANYVARLFQRHSRLLVVRIDFSYADGLMARDFVAQKSFEEAKADMQRFLNNRRSNSLFEHLVGYIAKLERGRTKGYHFHTFFFFDGSKVQKDEYIADQMGAYWKKVAGEHAVYFNCNRNKIARYRRLGIGMIDHSDLEKRRNLLLALAYVTKVEQLYRHEGERLLQKGEVRAVTRAGRPRNDA
jgi:hypothetical protein